MKQDNNYTYKVEHLPTSTAHYTHDKQEAYDTYQKFRSDFGDGIRIYEAPMPINDHDEIEWEVIEYYDEDEEDTPVMSNTVDKHTPGPWVYRQSRGNNAYEYKVVIPGGRTICEIEANDLEDIKTVIANAALIASAPQLKKENEELKERNRVLVEALERIKSIYDNKEDAAGVIAKEALQSNQ